MKMPNCHILVPPLVVTVTTAVLKSFTCEWCVCVAEVGPIFWRFCSISLAVWSTWPSNRTKILTKQRKWTHDCHVMHQLSQTHYNIGADSVETISQWTKLLVTSSQWFEHNYLYYHNVAG